MIKKLVIFSLLLSLVTFPIFSQQPYKDKGIFKKYNNKFWEKIAKETATYYKKSKPEKPLRFQVDLTGKKFPTDIKKYHILWHNPPISQGNSGTCWAFSTTSFLESEIYRLTGKKVKLSEMYTVYWETVEKARRFVRERGNSLFEQGSEANAVIRMWKKYGIVPERCYPGKKPSQRFHAHDQMFFEMKTYLKAIERDQAWNEEMVLSTIKAILNRYMGEPPKVIKVDGKTYTPKEYLKSLKINLDDYIDILSLLQEPYYEFVEYKVPDNWWHAKTYLNVPLNDFMNAIKYAITHGYNVFIGGDVTEPGRDIERQVCIVPTFDIPREYIDEYSRQFRFSNKTTTDDHGMHCVGYYIDKNGDYWFLIKDSGSGSRNGKYKGYFFFREDYVKLKILDIMVHKDAVKDILKKFKEKHMKKSKK